jgi:hypothetical protein
MTSSNNEFLEFKKNQFKRTYSTEAIPDNPVSAKKLQSIRGKLSTESTFVNNNINTINNSLGNTMITNDKKTITNDLENFTRSHSNKLPKLNKPRNNRYKSIETMQTALSTLSNDTTNYLNMQKLNFLKANKQGIDNNLDVDNMRLTKNSKRLVVIRVIILFIAFIYFPFESLMSNRLDDIELKTIFIYIDKLLSEDFINNSFFSYVFSILNYMIDMECINIYCCIVYLIYHPFRAVKMVIFLSLGCYFIIILRMIYGDSRPFWYYNTEVINCELSYANPSITTFSIMLFISLFMFQFAETYTKVDEHYLIPKSKKVLAYIIFFTTFLLVLSLHLITKTNFIYQQFFALVITLIMMVIIMDVEVSLHNFLLECFKTVSKTRKYKIYIFIYTLCLSIFSAIVFSIISDERYTKIQLKNVIQIESCENKVYLFGIKAAFMETTVIYNILGIFWGAGFTVEKELAKWWGSSWEKTLGKLVIIAIFSAAYFISIKFLNFYIHNFELIYFIGLLKNFFYFLVCFGYMPYLFQALGWNEEFSNNLNSSFIDDEKDAYVIKQFNKKISLLDNIKNSGDANFNNYNVNSQQQVPSFKRKSSFKKGYKTFGHTNVKSHKLGIIDSIEQRNDNFINYEDNITEVDEDNHSVSTNIKENKKSFIVKDKARNNTYQFNFNEKVNKGSFTKPEKTRHKKTSYKIKSNYGFDDKEDLNKEFNEEVESFKRSMIIKKQNRTEFNKDIIQSSRKISNNVDTRNSNSNNNINEEDDEYYGARLRRNDSKISNSYKLRKSVAENHMENNENANFISQQDNNSN